LILTLSTFSDFPHHDHFIYLWTPKTSKKTVVPLLDTLTIDLVGVQFSRPPCWQ